MNSKYRSPLNNQLLTTELLWETAIAMDGRDSVLYTLRPSSRELNGRTIPSLKALYMECGDTSEYSFAIKYFESWEHWQKVRSNTKITPFIDKWAQELEFRIRKEAFDRLKEAAENGSLEANKFIVSSNFIQGIPEKVYRNTKTPAKPVGRPSSKPETSEEMAANEEMKRVVEDMKRLQVN